jgi:hypothetical protein
MGKWERTFITVVTITGSLCLILFILTCAIVFILRKSKLKWKKNKFPPKSVSQHGITSKYIRDTRMNKLIEEQWNRRRDCLHVLNDSQDETSPQMHHQLNHTTAELIETRVNEYAKLVISHNTIQDELSVRKFITTSPAAVSEALQYYKSDIAVEYKLYRLPNESMQDFMWRVCKICGLSRANCMKYINLYEKAKYGPRVTVDDAREFISFYLDLVNELENKTVS